MYIDICIAFVHDPRHTNIACPNYGHKEHALPDGQPSHNSHILVVPGAIFYQGQAKTKETRIPVHKMQLQLFEIS